MIGYTVSFFPGSSGRFIANILYGLLNDIRFETEWTKENSAHNNTIYKSNIDFSKIPKTNHEAQSNYLRLFKHLQFLQSDYVPVLPTHAYPLEEDLDTNPHRYDLRMLIISLTQNDLLEINTNHIVKNIWPLIDKLKSVGFEGLPKEESLYMYDLIKSLAEYKLNLLQLKNINVVQEYAMLASKKQMQETFNKFLNTTVSSKYIEKTLIIKYSDLFVETNASYKGLDLLSKWCNKSITLELAETYVRYVKGRNTLISNFDFLKEV